MSQIFMLIIANLYQLSIMSTFFNYLRIFGAFLYRRKFGVDDLYLQIAKYFHDIDTVNIRHTMCAGIVLVTYVQCVNSLDHCNSPTYSNSSSILLADIVGYRTLGYLSHRC